MHRLLRRILLIGVVCLPLPTLSCGGDAESTGDGDTQGDGDGIPPGDGDAPGDGGAAGDGDASTGDGDGSGDGDAAGDGDPSSGGSSGETGSGGSLGTGLCREQSCGGHCAPADPEAATCGDDWICLDVLTCARDLESYCGCDGQTFHGSSNCAPFSYAHRGSCEDGIFGGLNCDASQVITDDLPPQCDYGYLPQVVGGTWGDCVAIEECGCGGSGSQDHCGPEYVCYNTGRCGHLLH